MRIIVPWDERQHRFARVGSICLLVFMVTVAAFLVYLLLFPVSERRASSIPFAIIFVVLWPMLMFSVFKLFRDVRFSPGVVFVEYGDLIFISKTKSRIPISDIRTVKVIPGWFLWFDFQRITFLDQDELPLGPGFHSMFFPKPVDAYVRALVAEAGADR